MIILHGLLGSLDNWQTLARRYSEYFTVFIIDQRNHGRSPHHENMDYDILAEDLLEFMESHWIYEAHLMGHSMGGKTVMNFASKNHDYVDKLVVVDMAPGQNDPNHDHIFEALFSVDVENLSSRDNARKLLKDQIEEEAVVQFLLKNLKRSKGNGYEWKPNLPGLFSNYEQIIAGLNFEESYPGPSLFVRGGDSDYINTKNISEIESLFTNAKFETIDGAGHWVHSEAQDEFFEKTLEFLYEK